MNDFCYRMKGHQTALHQAAVVGNRDAISALIRGVCALDLQDKEGNSALHEVSWHGFSPCVKLLVQVGADVLVKNKAGNTALHLACQNGHCQTARMLLLAGAVPDSKNNASDTCLHIAARYNNSSVIKILLGSSCSIAEKNQVGETAFHVAAGLNHKKTVSLLLEAGADACIRNDAGHTVLDKARDNNNRDLAILLAKSNQVQKKKKKEVLWTPSIPRDQVPQEKLQISDKNFTEVVEAQAQSGDHLLHNIQPEENKVSPCMRRKIKRSIQKMIRKFKHVFQKDCSFYEEDELPHGKAFQLYNLYRDKDGQIKQAPAKDCYCKPLLRKLENKLRATEMEMRLQIHTVQEEMNSRLGKVELKNKRQIKVLEKLTQEHVSAERMECHYRINQRATLECMEGKKRQVATTKEVKSWCMSKIQDLEMRTPETRHYKLLRSPSVDDSMDTESEGLPLLSLISEESSSSLATYVNVLPSPGAGGKSFEFEDALGRRHYNAKRNGSSDVSTYKGIDRCDSSASNSLFTSSNLSKQFTDSDTDTLSGPAGKHSKHLKNRIKAHRTHTQQGGAVSTLEVFAQGPADATFIQERANLHAVEVTQRFFETVSTQLERWYERKIQEAQRVVEQKALQDRVSLLQKINTLEEELQRLRTNTETKC
ncbi:putative ankyrin repeat domain-containing protein 6-like [Triplophysa rosa]|uniref:Ankyrin repeat domain-containing protein 6-like n=1 Tax=Triplophysa rosa TaxID=992332 RepID=A0A9W7TXK9_TRIRA|nr:putative ankyrin repeat domain-containing protein 6-like [Triplophysa rosa]